ncbi:PAS domain-containing protein [Limnothrix sp. PR1529]|uniref:PAS domain-containing protein n=1 Tax=Limnothrix sp. PR1529 TaxID=1704291 RepID=UPI00081EE35B|nr:PAS domain-containing protein [Limnothrix sp. PR1529]OCQ98094.1 hypothetical protein BCR12_08790 [Limnothrix sp. P13C2]
MTASIVLEPEVFNALQQELETLRLKVRQQQTQFDRLTQNLPGVVYQFQVDAAGEMTFPYASIGCRELFEVEPEGMIQAIEMLSLADRETLMQATERSRQNLSDFHWEGPFMLPSGKERWLRLVSRPERLADGRTLWDGLVIDVTQQRQAEEELRRTQRFLSAVLDALPMPVVVKEAAELRVSTLNPAAERLFGVAAADLLGRPMDELFMPEEAAELRSGDRAALAQRQILDQPPMPMRIGGEQRWLQSRRIAIWNGDRPQYLMAIYEDVTERYQSEQELLRQQALLKSLIAAAPIGIAITDRHYRILEANHRLSELNGLTVADHLGQTMQATAPNLAPHLERIYEEVWQTGQAISNLELTGAQLHHPDPDRVWNLSYFPIWDREGTISAIGTIVVEITEQRRIETALRQANSRFQQIADNLPGIVFQYRRRTGDPLGEFIYISSRVREIFHVEPDAILADSAVMWGCVHPDDVAIFAESMERAVNHGLEWRHKYRILLPSGELRWIQGISRMVLDEEGTLHADGLLLDITDRQLALQNLEQMRDRFQRLADSIPGVIYQYETSGNDPVGRFLYLSPGCQEVYGIDPLRGQNDPLSLWTLTHPDDLLNVQTSIRVAIETRADWQYEYRIITPQGEVKWLQSAARGRFLKDGRSIWDGLILDVTDRKAAEVALQQERSLMQLVLDNVSDGVMACDMAGRITLANHTARQWYNCNLQGLLPEEWMSLYTVLEPDGITPIAPTQMPLSRAILGESVHDFEMVVHVPNEDPHRIVCHAEPLRESDGYQIGAMVVMYDVTEYYEAQERLRRLTESLQEAQRVAHLGSWEYHVATGEVSWSEEIFRLFNYPIEEGVPEFDQSISLYSPSSQQRLQMAFEECLSDGQSYDLELEGIEQINGLSRYFRVKGLPERDANGQIVRVYGILMDISDLKQAEAIRRRSEVRFRTLIEATSQIVWVTSRLGEFAADQPKWRAFTGQSRQDLLGWGWLNAIHPADRAATEAAWSRSIISKQPFTLEHRLRRYDGQYRYMSVRAVPILDDVASVYEWVGVHTDITDRKLAELELFDREAFLRTIFDGVEYPIFVLAVLPDRRLEYIGWNAASARLTGLHESRVYHHTPTEVFGEEYGAIMEAHYWSCVDQRQTIVQDEYVTTQKGHLWLLTTLNPLFDKKGRVYRIVATSIDITKRRQAEDALQQKAADLEAALLDLQHTQNQLIQSEKMSSLGQLVAGVAHEINNPVNFIHGNLSHAHRYAEDLLEIVQAYQERIPNPDPDLNDLIEEVDLEFVAEDLPKLLQSMRVGTDRIREIVSSLRNFSRLDEADVKEVDLHEGIDSTLLILQNRLKPKPEHPGIQVVKQYGVLPRVECYAGQLNQVFMNILVNAIDALEERDRLRDTEAIKDHPSQITITTRAIDSRWVQVQLSDNGPGIAPDIQQRLFDPFFTTKPVGKGTGLGMSISYQIVTERHGGRLICESAPGQGATFIIEIPHHQTGPAAHPET